MSNEQEMRKAFEAAVTAHFEKPTDLTREGDGYSDGYVDNAWWGYKAATLAAEARIRELRNIHEAILHGDFCVTLTFASCRSASAFKQSIDAALTKHKENQG